MKTRRRKCSFEIFFFRLSPSSFSMWLLVCAQVKRLILPLFFSRSPHLRRLKMAKYSHLIKSFASLKKRMCVNFGNTRSGYSNWETLFDYFIFLIRFFPRFYFNFLFFKRQIGCNIRTQYYSVSLRLQFFDGKNYEAV